MAIAVLAGGAAAFADLPQLVATEVINRPDSEGVFGTAMAVGGDWCTTTMVSTTNIAGAFRVTREGDTVTSYYRDNGTGDWIDYRVATVPAEPVFVRVGHYHGSQNLTVRYDNFVIFCPDAECIGDLDGSGAVNFADLLTLLASWGECAADFNGDGDVGFVDLVTLLSAWGPCQ